MHFLNTIDEHTEKCLVRLKVCIWFSMNVKTLLSTSPLPPAPPRISKGSTEKTASRYRPSSRLPGTSTARSKHRVAASTTATREAFLRQGGIPAPGSGSARDHAGTEATRKAQPAAERTPAGSETLAPCTRTRCGKWRTMTRTRTRKWAGGEGRG